MTGGKSIDRVNEDMSRVPVGRMGIKRPMPNKKWKLLCESGGLYP